MISLKMIYSVSHPMCNTSLESLFIQLAKLASFGRFPY